MDRGQLWIGLGAPLGECDDLIQRLAALELVELECGRCELTVPDWLLDEEPRQLREDVCHQQVEHSYRLLLVRPGLERAIQNQI